MTDHDVAIKRLKGKLKKNWRDWLFVALLLALPIASFAVFWLYVNFEGIVMAFQQMDPVTNTEYFTLDNFKEVFLDMGKDGGLVGESLLNTFLIYGAGVFIATPITIVIAFFMMKGMPMTNFYKVLFFLPSMISQVAFVYVFMYFIGVSGPIKEIYINMGGSADNFPVFLGEGWAMPTILFFGIWSSFGYSTIVYASTMNRIPPELFESAKLDGAGFGAEFFKICLPLIWPTISTFIVVNLAGSCSGPGVVLLMTGGSFHTNTVGYWMYDVVSNSGDGSNMYYPAAFGLVISLFLVPLVWIVRKIVNSFWQDAQY